MEMEIVSRNRGVGLTQLIKSSINQMGGASEIMREFTGGEDSYYERYNPASFPAPSYNRLSERRLQPEHRAPRKNHEGSGSRSTRHEGHEDSSSTRQQKEKEQI